MALETALDLGKYSTEANRHMEEQVANVSEENPPKREVLPEVRVEAAPHRRISKSLIIACVITCLGIWQAIHLSKDGEPLFQPTARVASGSADFDPASRIPRGRPAPSADPVGAYIERSKRGMTDQEIRWLIEDFQQIGIMPTSGDIQESRSFRQRQNRWYLAALAEALSLTPEQRRTVQNSLKTSVDQAEEQFKQNVAGSGLNGIWIELYLEATLWLRNSELAPWKLCVLSESQSALTSERRGLEQKNNAMRMKIPLNWEVMWLDSSSLTMQDPVSGKRSQYPPPSPLDLACTMVGTIKGGIINISDVFPLTVDQKLAEHRNNVAAQARLLQPAQLRIALLLNPSLAQTLLHQLDNPPTRVEPVEVSGSAGLPPP